MINMCALCSFFFFVWHRIKKTSCKRRTPEEFEKGAIKTMVKVPKTSQNDEPDPECAVKAELQAANLGKENNITFRCT